MPRRCGGCGARRYKTPERATKNLTMDERVKFVELVDAGATVKQIKKELKMWVSEINDNVYLLPYHKLVIEETKRLVDNKHLLDGTSEEQAQYEALRGEVDRKIQKKWREMTNG